MKILLYTRRNVGLYCLSHLVALGHEVSVMTDDEDVNWLADRYGCRVVENGAWEMMPDYDLFICIHGNKIIPGVWLKGLMVNIHPCLTLGLKGKNPVKRYMEAGFTKATVSSHFMTELVDGGEIIHTEEFETGDIYSYQEFYDAALPHYYKCLEQTLNKILK